MSEQKRKNKNFFCPVCLEIRGVICCSLSLLFSFFPFGPFPPSPFSSRGNGLASRSPSAALLLSLSIVSLSCLLLLAGKRPSSKAARRGQHSEALCLTLITNGKVSFSDLDVRPGSKSGLLFHRRMTGRRGTKSRETDDGENSPK